MDYRVLTEELFPFHKQSLFLDTIQFYHYFVARTLFIPYVWLLIKRIQIIYDKQKNHYENIDKGWASVLNTFFVKSTTLSSLNNKYKYFAVSAKKKLSARSSTEFKRSTFSRCPYPYVVLQFLSIFFHISQPHSLHINPH